MSADVLIVNISETAESSRRLEALANFMGLTTSIVPPETVWNNSPESQTQPACIIAAADGLLNLTNDFKFTKTPTLIYGFRDCAEHSALLEKITNGRICGVTPIKNVSEYNVPADSEMMDKFAGLSFGPASRLLDCTFKQTNNDKPALAEIGGQPFFTKISPDAACSTYLLGCAGVADIDASMYTLPPLSELFSSLVCYMLFMRACAGNNFTQPHKHHAVVTIDDPLLRPSYGFLNYEELLAHTHRHNYCVSVSHIPSNINRVSDTTVRLFRENSDKFSLCIHGCNHLRGEFAATDRDALHTLTATALALMRKFSERTNINYDNLMVFPHGLFSVDALDVLHRFGVCAAAASVESFAPRHNPAGDTKRTRLRLRDFMGPVITAYGGSPLLLRRYPRNMEEFAFDMLLGRPLIITTHHGNFRDNAEKLHNFIDQLNTVAPNLIWTSLANIAKSCSLCGDDAEVCANEFSAGNLSKSTVIKSTLKRHLMTLRDSTTALKNRRGAQGDSREC